MNPEEQKEYEEHYSPDGERIQYLMEHPEENMTSTNKKWEGWQIHQKDCAYNQRRGKWHWFPCDMNCENVFEGKVSNILSTQREEMLEKVRSIVLNNSKEEYTHSAKSFLQASTDRIMMELLSLNTTKNE